MQNKLSAISFRVNRGDFFSEITRLVRTNAYNRCRSDRTNAITRKDGAS